MTKIDLKKIKRISMLIFLALAVELLRSKLYDDLSRDDNHHRPEQLYPDGPEF